MQNRVKRNRDTMWLSTSQKERIRHRLSELSLTTEQATEKMMIDGARVRSRWLQRVLDPARSKNYERRYLFELARILGMELKQLLGARNLQNRPSSDLVVLLDELHYIDIELLTEYAMQGPQDWTDRRWNEYVHDKHSNVGYHTHLMSHASDLLNQFERMGDERWKRYPPVSLEIFLDKMDSVTGEGCFLSYYGDGLLVGGITNRLDKIDNIARISHRTILPRLSYAHIKYRGLDLHTQFMPGLWPSLFIDVRTLHILEELEILPSSAERVLNIGSGTGFQFIVTFAHSTSCKVLAFSEFLPRMQHLIGMNILKNDEQFRHIDRYSQLFYLGRLYAQLKEERFDLVLCNPPLSILLDDELLSSPSSEYVVPTEMILREVVRFPSAMAERIYVLIPELFVRSCRQAADSVGNVLKKVGPPINAPLLPPFGVEVGYPDAWDQFFKEDSDGFKKYVLQLFEILRP